MAASREESTTLRAGLSSGIPVGTCLARYRVEHSRIEWSLDDDCMLAQLTAILPEG